MTSLRCALALLGGAVGAGFASGRELVRFFALHGALSIPSALCAVAFLNLLLRRIPAKMERAGVSSVAALCRASFGLRFGGFCAALFFLLEAVAAGAMLAACAELVALTLPLRRAEALGLALSLAAALLLARAGLGGIALPGAALCALLPIMLSQLLTLPAGEACFSPGVMRPMLAAADGAVYAALNAAMLLGVAPMLLPLAPAQRRRSVHLFCLLFGALLLLGIAVCRRHLPAVLAQPLPFAVLSRRLGRSGYLLLAGCLYASALSTLCAMLAALSKMLGGRARGLLGSGAIALGFAVLGFDRLVSVGYPTLGATCAALLLLLCLPDFSQTPLNRP